MKLEYMDILLGFQKPLNMKTKRFREMVANNLRKQADLLENIETGIEGTLFLFEEYFDEISYLNKKSQIGVLEIKS